MTMLTSSGAVTFAHDRNLNLTRAKAAIQIKFLSILNTHPQASVESQKIFMGKSEVMKL